MLCVFEHLNIKKQRLVLNKNWKHVLSRISNFKKKLGNHASSVKNCETKASQSNKTNKTTVSSSTELKIIQYLVFGLSVICLPGLIILYLAIPKIQIFTKFLYNLSDDWLENMVLSHSYLFSTHHYLYMSSVIFGNNQQLLHCNFVGNLSCFKWIIYITSFNTSHSTRNLTVLQLYKSHVCIFYAAICRRIWFGHVNVLQ